jgi:hypothetical protein
VFGWGQEETLQSVKLGEGGVTFATSLPPDVDPDRFPDGDGTVPKVSAVPIELDDTPPRWWPVNQKHATLQNNNDLLQNLAQLMRALQGAGQPPARGPGTEEGASSVSLQMDHAFLADEPVRLAVTVDASDEPEALWAEVTPRAASEHPPRRVELKPTGRTWTGTCADLPPGVYRVAVHARGLPRGPSEPVSDLFEIV